MNCHFSWQIIHLLGHTHSLLATRANASSYIEQFRALDCWRVLSLSCTWQRGTWPTTF